MMLTPHRGLPDVQHRQKNEKMFLPSFVTSSPLSAHASCPPPFTALRGVLHPLGSGPRVTAAPGQGCFLVWMPAPYRDSCEWDLAVLLDTIPVTTRIAAGLVLAKAF